MLLATLSVASCSSGDVVCPAIGWINKLTIQLEGDVSQVADVTLCVDDLCVPSEDGTAPDELAQVGQAAQDGNTGQWVFTTSMSTPESFSVRVLSADGTVLANAPASANWVRVGGSEQCGGPRQATVIVQL